MTPASALLHASLRALSRMYRHFLSVYAAQFTAWRGMDGMSARGQLKLRSVQPYERDYVCATCQLLSLLLVTSTSLRAPNLFLMMMILGCASTTLQRGDALLVPCCSFVGAADHSSRCHVRTTPAISDYQSAGLQPPPPDTFTPVKLHAGSRLRPSAPLRLLPKHTV